MQPDPDDAEVTDLAQTGVQAITLGESHPPAENAASPNEPVDTTASSVGLEASRQDDQRAPPAGGQASPWEHVPSVFHQPPQLDITENFRTASKFVAPGQLVKDEHFPLLESVSALEMLDRKTDSGFVAPGATIESDYDVSSPLSAQQVLGVMDEVLCYEMAWHRGYPLSQTLFTCYYIEKLLSLEPKSIDDAKLQSGTSRCAGEFVTVVLRAYCLGVLKCCEAVIETVRSGLYFEEEDLCCWTYGQELLNRIPSADVVQALFEADTYLRVVSTREPETKLVMEALQSRLAYRLKLVKVTVPDVEPLKFAELTSEALQYVTSIQASRHLAVPVEEAFSARLQRRLASTVAPRPIVRLSFEEACTQASQLEEDKLAATKVLEYLMDPKELRNFLQEYAARDPAPLAHSRAVLQTIVLSIEKDRLEYWISKELGNTILGGHPALDRSIIGTNSLTPSGRIYEPRSRWEVELDRFHKSIKGPYQDLLAAYCQNRTRLRRILCHVVTSLDNAEREVSAPDEQPNESTTQQPLYALSSWITFEKIRQMEAVIQLGFEQDVYLPDELGGMYWYLGCLFEARGQCVMQMLDFLRDTTRNVVEHKRREPIDRAEAYLRTLFDLTSSLFRLAEALRILYNILGWFDKIPTPPRPYGSAKLRYELRMKPFLSVSWPGVPTFETFHSHVHQSGTDYGDMDKEDIAGIARLHEHAEQCVKGAKADMQRVKNAPPGLLGVQGILSTWEQERTGVYRSLVTVGLALSQVRRGVGEPHEPWLKTVRVEIPEKGKRGHDQWIVPVVQEVK